MHNGHSTPGDWLIDGTLFAVLWGISSAELETGLHIAGTAAVCIAAVIRAAREVLIYRREKRKGGSDA